MRKGFAWAMTVGLLFFAPPIIRANDGIPPSVKIDRNSITVDIENGKLLFLKADDEDDDKPRLSYMFTEHFINAHYVQIYESGYEGKGPLFINLKTGASFYVQSNGNVSAFFSPDSSRVAFLARDPRDWNDIDAPRPVNAQIWKVSPQGGSIEEKIAVSESFDGIDHLTWKDDATLILFKQGQPQMSLVRQGINWNLQEIVKGHSEKKGHE